MDSDYPLIPIVFNPVEDFCFIPFYEIKFAGDSDWISYDGIVLICEVIEILFINCVRVCMDVIIEFHSLGHLYLGQAFRNS